MSLPSPVAVRTVAIIGPPGAGKTTLLEALAHATGERDQRGRVEEGTTLSDRLPEEKAHHHSIRLSAVTLTYNGSRLNFIDVPGNGEFLPQLCLALDSASIALLVVGVESSLSPEVTRLWSQLQERKLPRAIFANKCDRGKPDFDTTVKSLQKTLSSHIDPIEIPLWDSSHLDGVVDVLTEIALHDHDLKADAIPAQLQREEKAAHDTLVDEIVQEDDALLESYLEGTELSPTELTAALDHGVATGALFPLLCGSATEMVGVNHLLDLLTEFAPPPCPPSDGPTLVETIAIESDPYQGRVATVSVRRGILKADQLLTNLRTGQEFRCHGLALATPGGNRSITEAGFNDLVLVPKAPLAVGDMAQLGPGSDGQPARATLPQPSFKVAVVVEGNKQDERASLELARIAEEDPGLSVSRERLTHLVSLTGMGPTHIGLTLERMTRQCGIRATTQKPETILMATLRAETRVDTRYKKQTGGHGQFADVSLIFSPAPRGQGIVFIDEIVGGAIPRAFIPAVEKGLLEAAASENRGGIALTDFTARLVDGKHHPVDSSEMSFKIAASQALKQAVEQVGVLLLEPISHARIIAPANHQGDVLAEITARRGRIVGTDIASDENAVVISADIPTGEMHTLILDLTTITSGSARIEETHARYEPAPRGTVGPSD